MYPGSSQNLIPYSNNYLEMKNHNNKELKLVFKLRNFSVKCFKLLTIFTVQSSHIKTCAIRICFSEKRYKNGIKIFIKNVPFDLRSTSPFVNYIL